ncbi:MAG: hypothetical protein CMI30_11800 [Opitutae bacterium]|nr:hypothetical protein [Opitutae bacterium]|tara:strand:+ start:773 stop:1312 length:540 start_codon:yes stop_codon:yes gene_type:complete
MLSTLLGISRKPTTGFRLSPFEERNLGTLLSWVQTNRDLRLWAGDTFPRIPDAPVFRKHLERTEVNAYQAESGKSGFVGYAELVRMPQGDGTLCRVIIDPSRRGMGWGKAFVRLLARESFESLGFNHLLLNVFTLNAPALRCYRSIGFRPLPHRPRSRCFEGETWNLLVMKKARPKRAA